jgi:hypothetical protein
MAWPNTRLLDFIDDSTPYVDADFLNEIQDTIGELYGGGEYFVTCGAYGAYTTLAAAVAAVKARYVADSTRRVRIMLVGNLTVPSTVTIDFPCMIEGADHDATLSWTADTTLIELAAGSSSSVFKNLVFDYAGTGTAAIALSSTTTAVTAVIVDSCTFQESSTGTLDAGIYSDQVSDRWKVTKCNFTQSDILTGIEFDNAGTDGVVIALNSFRSSKAASIAVKATTGTNYLIVDNYFAQVKQAVNVGANYSTVAKNSTLGATGIAGEGVIECSGDYCTIESNCVIDWTVDSPINTTGLSPRVRNNCCSTSAASGVIGVYVLGAAGTDIHGEVCGNLVELERGASSGNGVAGAIGIQIGSNQDLCKVVDNVVRNCGTGAGVGIGIYVNAPGAQVVGNYVYNTRGVGIHIAQAACQTNNNYIYDYGTTAGIYFGASASSGQCNDNFIWLPNALETPISLHASSSNVQINNNRYNAATSITDAGASYVGPRQTRVIASGNSGNIATNNTYQLANLTRFTGETVTCSVWLVQDNAGEKFGQSVDDGDHAVVAAKAHFTRTANPNQFNLEITNDLTGTRSFDYVVLGITA